MVEMEKDAHSSGEPREQPASTDQPTAERTASAAQVAEATPQGDADASSAAAVEAKGQDKERRQKSRGRRQGARQDDQAKQMVYRPKTAGAPATGGAEEDSEQQRPATTRNRRDEYEGGEEKRPRRRNRTQKRKAAAEANDDANDGDAPKERAAPKKETSERDKARAALEKKREKMGTQYVPFKSQRTYKSRFQQYQVGEWRRQRNNLFVTMETIVPPLPSKPLEEPDDTQYHLDVARMDEQIEQLYQQLQDLKGELHEKRTTMMDGQQGRAPIKESLRELFSELDIYNAEKKTKLASVEQLNREINELQAQIQKDLKGVHPVYNEESKLDKGIKELERRIATQRHSKAEEDRLIKEIDKVRESKPLFAKISEKRAHINELREKINAVRQEMLPTNKIISSLKDRIGAEKTKESEFEVGRQHYKHAQTLITSNMDKAREKINELRDKKRALKEDFYGQMCDYEIEQAYIKDVKWISQTKLMVMERTERQEQRDLERKERAEQRKKNQEERRRREDEYKAQQEARRKEAEERRRQWEEQELEKLDVHPYLDHIDLCEELIYFCARSRRSDTPEEAKSGAAGKAKNGKADRERQHIDEVKKGKVEVALSKAEREAAGTGLASVAQSKKKQQRKRDGPSQFYGGEDENRLDLDYVTIQKFSRVELSPPIDFEDLESTSDKLTQLRDALKMRGLIQQAEDKGTLVKDPSFTDSPEYKANVEQFEGLDSELRKKVEKIRQQVRYRSQRDEDDEAEAERGNGYDDRGGETAGTVRYTNLRPDRRGREEGRGGMRGRRGGKRDLEMEGGSGGAQGQGRRRGRQDQNGPREKIGGNENDFPGL